MHYKITIQGVPGGDILSYVQAATIHEASKKARMWASSESTWPAAITEPFMAKMIVESLEGPKATVAMPVECRCNKVDHSDVVEANVSVTDTPTIAEVNTIMTKLDSIERQLTAKLSEHLIASYAIEALSKIKTDIANQPIHFEQEQVYHILSHLQNILAMNIKVDTLAQKCSTCGEIRLLHSVEHYACPNSTRFRDAGKGGLFGRGSFTLEPIADKPASSSGV